MSKIRLEKINSQIKKNVSLIIDNNINDPRVTGFVSVTSVNITPDLKYATIALSIYNNNKEETLQIIKNAEGFIKRNLTKTLNLRVVPNLIFELDNSYEYSEKINKIIAGLNIPSEDKGENN